MVLASVGHTCGITVRLRWYYNSDGHRGIIRVRVRIIIIQTHKADEAHPLTLI